MTDLEKLEKRVKKLEEQLKNYSFLINLSKELKIDKTIVHEVATYRTKATLYDQLLSNTKEERVVSRKEIENYRTEVSFLNGVIEVLGFWATKEQDKSTASEMREFLNAYKEMKRSLK